MKKIEYDISMNDNKSIQKRTGYLYTLHNPDNYGQVIFLGIHKSSDVWTATELTTGLRVTHECGPRRNLVAFLDGHTRNRLGFENSTFFAEIVDEVKVRRFQGKANLNNNLIVDELMDTLEEHQDTVV